MRHLQTRTVHPEIWFATTFMSFTSAFFSRPFCYCNCRTIETEMITNMKHYDPFNVKITIKKVANRKLAQPICDDMGNGCVLKIKMAGNGGFVFILSKEDYSDRSTTCSGTKSIPLEQSSNFTYSSSYSFPELILSRTPWLTLKKTNT